MKLKLLAGVAMAGVAAAATAYAAPSDTGWYGAIDLGGHFPQGLGTHGSVNELTGPPADLRFDTKANFVGFARIGYKVTPHMRIELEGGYRPGDLGSVTETHFSGRPAGSVS